MKFNTWQHQVKKLKTATSLLLISNLLLGSCLLASVYFQATTKPIVVVQPMLQQQALEIRAQTLTRSYAISFSISMALLLGNVTSANMSFVLESISQYVAPDYFAQFRKQLVADMSKLQEKRMDMTFVITKAEIAKDSNEVVVDGIATIIDAAGNRITNAHQFRFLIDMHDYVPRIRQIRSIALDRTP